MKITDYYILDCNSIGARTRALDTSGYAAFEVYIRHFTGTNINHVLVIRESDDKKNWENILTNTDEIKVGGAVKSTGSFSKKYLQVIVDTVEDGPSNVKILYILT